MTKIKSSNLEANIQISGQLRDSANSSGTSGQVFSSTGTGTQWITPSAGGSSTLSIVTKTSAYTVVIGDLGKIINCTTSAFTVTLTAAATLGAGFYCSIWNSCDSNQQITIDPNASETIDGLSTLILYPGEGMQIICDGTNWITGTPKELKAFAEHTRPGDTRPQSAGTWAVAIGSGSNASGSQSISIGRNSSATGDTSLAIGMDSVAASGGRSTAIGSNSNAQGSISISEGAMALGGSYASGSSSLSAAGATNSTSYGSQGGNSISIGYQTRASGTYSVALGYKATVEGSGGLAISTFGWSASGATVQAAGAMAIGNKVTTGAVGYYAICIGTDIVNTGRNALVLGIEAKNDVIGKISWANGKFADNGDNQLGMMLLRSDTTDATAEALTSNNSAASATNQFILPNNSAYAFSGLVVARQAAAGGTASAAWKIEGLIRREGTAGTTTLIASTVTAISNAPGWGLALSADTTNGGLAITATGAAATNIRWAATLNSSEVTY